MQKVYVQLEDDLTGGPADETVSFGIDGKFYEIDLNAKHAASFRKQLATFAQRARVTPRRASTTARSTASRQRSHAIRAWAEDHGFDIAAHGRLPTSVIQAYDREQRDGQQEERPGAGRAPRRGRRGR
jgi:Lsr2